MRSYREENKHLKAQRDELLEALKKLIKQLSREDMLAAKEQWYIRELDEARAAIAKARGT